MQEQREVNSFGDRASALAPFAPQHLGLPSVAENSAQPTIFRAILRHAWLVVLFGILGVGGAYLFLQRVQPLYSSHAKIYIQPSTPKLLTSTDVMGVNQRSSYLYTQCEKIRSTSVLALAVDMPGIRELRTLQNVGNPVLYLREVLQAEVGRRDDIITVALESPYPEDAAKIVNSIVEAYQKYQTTEKRTANTDLLNSLTQTKAKSDAELDAVRDRMVEFTAKHPRMSFTPMYNSELAALSNALTTAKIATVTARANYPAGNPAVIRAERAEEELQRKYDEAQQRYMELDTLLGQYQQMNLLLEEKKEFVKRLDDRIREVQMNADAEKVFDNIEIMEPARVAQQPSYPRKNRTMAVALAAGMLLGAGLALLRDRMDGRMRSVEEIQTVVGLPILGVVPAMSGRRTAVARAMTVHLDPRSVVAEAYRSVRTAVYFGAGTNRCRTILVTSPEPGDGKTTSASNLAIAIAQTGRSVLLLDADFRKPTQHKNLDIKDAVGLSSVLAGRETLTKAIQHTGVDGLDILPCGPIPANPSEILNSRKFGELVDSLAEKYDHILFDSPPVNAVTDARILGAVCDATVLVLRADKSTKKSGEHARNALMSVGAQVLGAIVNDAPRRKGYEVYGGSYYGTPDVVIRAEDRRGDQNGRRRLTGSTVDAVD